MPKVSIVLPVYNGMRYICESIDSIREQTFSDWELIVVDDCSTDDTPQIIEGYVKKEPRIRVIHNAENQRLPKSLNIGFAAAKGKYFTWTSDDNCYLPLAIERMVKFLDEKPDIYLVSAGMNSMDCNGHILDRFYFYDERNLLYENNVGACFMYRREVLKEIGGYDPTFFLVEDYEYWLRIFFHYGEIGNIQDVLYLYRFHDSSLTSTRSMQIKRQGLRLFETYIDNILDRGCRKDYLCKIYYEFMEMKMDLAKKKRIIEYVPELRIDVGIDRKKPIIAYGAGYYGNQAYMKFGNQISYYADYNHEKCGQFKNGKRILSVTEMLDLLDRCQILICVAAETVYEVLNSFLSMGIKACCVYQNS